MDFIIPELAPFPKMPDLSGQTSLKPVTSALNVRNRQGGLDPAAVESAFSGLSSRIDTLINAINSIDVTTVLPFVYDNLRLLREDQAKLQETLKKARLDIKTSGGEVTGARDETEGAGKNLLTTLASQGIIVDSTTAS